MGPMFNIDFLKNLSFWFAFGMIGATFGQGMSAVTGDAVGQVEPRFAWMWFVGGMCCNTLVVVVKWLMQKELMEAQGEIAELKKMLGEQNGN